MRVLMLGTVNSPHVEDLVLGLGQRGIEVVVGGEQADNLPPSTLGERGIRVELAPPGALVAPGRLMRRRAWVRRLVREVRPDVVHAHFLVEDPFYAVLAGARPLVATAWGSDVFKAARIGRLRSRVVSRRADLLTADSKTLLDALVGLGADRSRLRLINWGVDVDAFSPGRADARRRLDLPDVPIVLAPRALKPVYNTQTVVAAFDRVAAQVPDVLLVLKHYGGLPPELAHLKGRENVRIVTHVPMEELVDYYRAASVCVSIPSSDSSPRSVWEAMACGCPCVLSDLAWVHESIEDGRDALVTPVDTGSVADAIGRVLREDGLARALAENGRALVERHHRRHTELDRVVEAYEAVRRR
jgi:glycosyltransferase involved in cell wall biosynthesis